MSRSQDTAASELFAALYPALAGWCRRLTDDDGTAHEIAAEAFTRLWARWTKVDEPRGFLYVTAAIWSATTGAERSGSGGRCAG